MSEPFRVPAEEIRQRTKRVQGALQQNNIDGMLVVQRVDLFYFSGTAQNAFLYIPAEGEPLLLVKKFLPRAQAESPLKQILPIGSLKEIPERIADGFGKPPPVLGLELDVMPVRNYRFFMKLFDGCKAADASGFIADTRMIKSGWEVDQMLKTADLSRRTFEYMAETLRPGITEMEFAGMFETFARKHGHGAQLRVRDWLTEGYPWHILSGKSGGTLGLLDSPASGEGTSPAFPCGGSGKTMEAGEPIMIDFGTVLNGYHMDETRMFAIGRLPQREKDACQAAIDIQQSVLEQVKPGVTLGELFDFSVARAGVLSYEEQYLGPPGHKVTFVGHGIGLELVEPPFIAKARNQPLEAGMTFSLEPKLVFEKEFSAGVEDVFLVTETGCRMITQIPTEIFII